MIIDPIRKSDYSDNLLKMSYTFPMQGHASTISLREGDLVAFMQKYTPEIDVEAFKLASITRMLNVQRYDLRVKVRYMLDNVMEPVFCMSLYDMEFDAKDSMALDGFEDFIEADKFPEFFTMAESIIDSLYTDGAFYITRNIDFKDRFWSFDDGCVIETEYHSINLKDKAIQSIAEHIRQDIEINGAATLEKAESSSKVDYMPMSFDSFKIQWPMDLELLKESDLSYTTLSKFLHKYNLPQKREA